MAVETEGRDGNNQLRDLPGKTLKMRHGFQSTHEPVLGHLFIHAESTKSNSREISEIRR